jgi:serine/threonine protein kinase
MTIGPGYVLERLLGAGGQSRVYAARPPDGSAEVAVKILSIARVKDPKALELFRRSAEVLASLSHPGVAPLITYFEEMRPPHAALYCLVQALVPGQTLAQGERLDEAGVVAIAQRVLPTLAYLHGLSPPVIHRDIKPSNLMRKPDGSIVLIDFDLVRDVLRPEGGSTLSIGTPGYTPMEQYMGEATPATDLYALGVTLAVLLARKDPTDMRRAGEQRLDLRRHINVGDRFLEVLEKLTDPEPARRYQSAREVMRDLDRLSSPGEAPARPRLDRRRAILAAGAVAVAVAAGAGIALLPGRHEPRAAQPAEPPPPRAPATPEPETETEPAPAPPPPRATVALSEERDPEPIWAALTSSAWSGTSDDRPMRVAFNGPFTEPAAMVDGKAAAVTFSGVGVITVHWTDTRGDTTTDVSAYLRLTRDEGDLVGTLETQFSNAGSTYDTRADINLRRIQ